MKKRYILYSLIGLFLGGGAIPTSAFAAIAYDNSIGSASSFTTISFTTTGSDIAIVVFCYATSPSYTSSSMTWNGVSMTRDDFSPVGNGEGVITFHIFNADAGTHDFVFTDAGGVYRCNAQSYTGVDHTVFDTAQVVSPTTGGTQNAPVATVTDGAYLVRGNYCNAPTFTSPATPVATADNIYSGQLITTTAGSYSLDSTSSSCTGALSLVALKPYSAGGGGGGATTTPAVMTYYDQMFMYGVLIFFLSFLTWGSIFGFIRSGEAKLK